LALLQEKCLQHEHKRLNQFYMNFAWGRKTQNTQDWISLICNQIDSWNTPIMRPSFTNLFFQSVIINQTIDWLIPGFLLHMNIKARYQQVLMTAVKWLIKRKSSWRLLYKFGKRIKGFRPRFTFNKNFSVSQVSNHKVVV